jgi:rubrerythrin
MGDWNSVEDVLGYAIEREQEAADFYTSLADNAEHAYMREIFEGFAREEKAHKARLTAIKTKGIFGSTRKPVADLQIGDYLVADETGDAIDYQGALILAMKKEKAAYRLYSDLAALADSEAMRNVFGRLADEEARHKLRFEIEYDDQILTEN